MVPTAVQEIELAIQGMGEPGQRVPVPGVVGSKRPLNRLPVQAILDMKVLGYIMTIVIVFDELQMLHPMIQRKSRRHEEQSKDECSLLCRHELPDLSQGDLLRRISTPSRRRSRLPFRDPSQPSGHRAETTVAQRQIERQNSTILSVRWVVQSLAGKAPMHAFCFVVPGEVVPRGGLFPRGR